MWPPNAWGTASHKAALFILMISCCISLITLIVCRLLYPQGSWDLYFSSMCKKYSSSEQWFITVMHIFSNWSSLVREIFTNPKILLSIGNLWDSNLKRLMCHMEGLIGTDLTADHVVFNTAHSLENISC